MTPHLAAALVVLALSGGTAAAQSFPGGLTGLTADRSARSVGDSLTVVILESSSAATTAQSGSRRDTRLAGTASAGSRSESGGVSLQGTYDGRGQNARSGRLIGQIGVTVSEILPNGDLRISGAQTVNVDGERTAIRLTARVRAADIGGDNTVVSSRLADARIDYEGDGSLARSGRPGVLNRILSWLGLV